MNSNRRLKVFIDRDRMWGDTFAVRIGTQINESTGLAVAEPVKFRSISEHEASCETQPCLTFHKDDAQAFMDELWHAGFRPTEGSGSSGSLAATQAHLKDMRAIVGKKLDVELK